MTDQAFAAIHRTVLRRSSYQVLLIASQLMVVTYLLLAVAHPVVLNGNLAWQLAVTAGSSAILFTALAFLLKRRTDLSLRSLAWVELTMIAVASINAFLHLYLSQDILQTTNIMLIFVVIALVVHGAVNLVASVVIIDSIWWYFSRDLPATNYQFIHFAFFLGLASLISIAVYLGRHSILRATTRELQKRQQTQSELRSMNQRLEELSNLDPLTGISNRRHFQNGYDSHLKRGSFDKQVMTFIVCDLDDFKQFNDANGHVSGDEALVAVAEALTSCIRGSLDLVARFGGEEFVMLLPGMDREAATHIAERILTKVRELRIGGQEITLSMGICTFEVSANFNPDDPYREADKALYIAKQQGKNQFLFAEDAA